jgi:hypothetical protein
MPYLFTRSLRVSGSLVDSMSWSTRITEKVNQIAEQTFALWTPVLSPQINRLTWATVVEDLAALTATDEKLMADGAFLELVAEGSKYNTSGEVDDQLVSFVHLDPEGSESAEYVAIVRATLAPGSFVEGVTLGVEIAQRAKAVTGHATSFGQATTGTYGEVGWMTLYDTIEQLQAAEEKINADAEFVALLDGRASKAYLAGSATQSISRKVM